MKQIKEIILTLAAVFFVAIGGFANNNECDLTIIDTSPVCASDHWEDVYVTIDINLVCTSYNEVYVAHGNGDSGGPAVISHQGPFTTGQHQIVLSSGEFSLWLVPTTSGEGPYIAEASVDIPLCCEPGIDIEEDECSIVVTVEDDIDCDIDSLYVGGIPGQFDYTLYAYADLQNGVQIDIEESGQYYVKVFAGIEGQFDVGELVDVSCNNCQGATEIHDVDFISIECEDGNRVINFTIGVEELCSSDTMLVKVRGYQDAEDADGTELLEYNVYPESFTTLAGTSLSSSSSNVTLSDTWGNYSFEVSLVSNPSEKERRLTGELEECVGVESCDPQLEVSTSECAVLVLLEGDVVCEEASMNLQIVRNSDLSIAVDTTYSTAELIDGVAIDGLNTDTYLVRVFSGNGLDLNTSAFVACSGCFGAIVDATLVGLCSPKVQVDACPSIIESTDMIIATGINGTFSHILRLTMPVGGISNEFDLSDYVEIPAEQFFVGIAVVPTWFTQGNGDPILDIDGFNHPGCLGGNANALIGDVTEMPKDEALKMFNGKVPSVSLYPNPAIDYINIEIGGEAIPNDALIKIFNTTGSLVLESTGTTIDISSIPTGTYILKTEFNDGKMALNKFIKQ